jgi:hypothetical protein
MKISHILNKVYDSDVGWRPASGAIKPVHVANGLIRSLQGQLYDVTKLHEFVVWWRAGKKPDDARTFTALLRDRPEIYAALEDPRRDFERTRRYIGGLLGADSGLFPSKNNSSFSLTHGRMVTSDANDRKLGEFGAVLLTTDHDQPSLAGAVLEAAASSEPRDPVSAVVWPLLGDLPKEVGKSDALEGVGKALGAKHNAQFLESAHLAAACLATHEQGQGNHMRTMQRAVQFVCISTLVHAQALAAGGELSSRPPALMTLAGHRRSDVAIASERSLDLIYRGFEVWLTKRLARLIDKGTPLVKGTEAAPADTIDGRRIRPFLASIGSATKGDERASESVVAQRMGFFKQAKQDLGDRAKPADILARTLVESYCREFAASGGPQRFLQNLGCRIGLMYPHFAGRAREKRVRPSVAVLDMLVRACVPRGDAVPLTEFLERLWLRFGLIVGGRREGDWDDAAFLASRGLPVDTPALLENTERLVDELAVMGLARRYADDVAFIGDGYDH